MDFRIAVPLVLAVLSTGSVQETRTHVVSLTVGIGTSCPYGLNE